MLIRLCCDYPCLIRADGESCGRLNGGEKQYLQAEDVVECLPLSSREAAIPVCFSLCQPPPTVTLTRYGSLLDFAVSLPRLPSPSTEILFQQAIATPKGNLLITIVRDGRDKITVDGNGLFGVFDLPCGMSDFSAEYGELSSAPCLAVFSCRDKKRYAFVYDLSCCRLIFRGEAHALTWGQTLTTVRTSPTLARHVVTTTWAYREGKLTATSIRAARSKDFCFFALRDFAKPFALAEEVLLGAVPTDFLTEDLRRSAADLTGYLGAFTAVELPPAACNRQGAALLYPCADGFTAKFLNVQTEGGLVSNLSLD